MGEARPRPLTLDAGALIALDRGSASVRALLRVAMDSGTALYVPAGVLAQAWRDGRTQARLAALLRDRAVRIVVLDGRVARSIGVLLRLSRASDVVDASVIVCARRYGATVVTSDPDDIRRLDPTLPILAV